MLLLDLYGALRPLTRSRGNHSDDILNDL